MASSDKNRFCVFLVFIILLIVFGAFYHPADGLSRPAYKNAPALTRSGN